MIELELLYEDGHCEQSVYPLPLLVGRDAECGLRVKSWRVARRHARIHERAGMTMLEDLGSLAGTFLNGRRVLQEGVLSVGDELIVGPCRIVLLSLQSAGATVSGMEGPSEFVQDHHAAASTGEVTISEPLKSGVPDCNGVESPCRDSVPEVAQDDAPLHDERFSQHRQRLHKALVEALDLRRRDILQLSDEALRSEAASVLSGILDTDQQLPAGIDRGAMLQQVVDEAVGLGPLEPLLADRSVSEIMVNAHEEIYVERAGKLVRHDVSFSSDQAVVAIIDRIVAPLGRRVDESSPMVDARLKDGSRVNAVIPPIALRGACLTIRKFPQRRLSMADLLAAGSLDQHMANFLSICIETRKSVLVSGGTGSGKTTLLNVLSNCIPVGERIITIEDAAELRLSHTHRVALEARPPNAEGKGKVEIRDLVRNALRMRPDRIIVGECRGAEAFDMLSAMNTGHEGSLTTLHANSARDALARLETMVLMAGMDLPLAAVREHIASAIDIIIQQARFADGRRLITAIVEVTGMEAGRIQIQELFRYRHGEPPVFEGCGVIPDCFANAAETLPLAWMNQSSHVTGMTGGTVWRS